MNVEIAPGQSLEAKGTEECAMFGNGFWLEQKLNGEVMGQPLRNHSFLGYDPLQKQYRAVGVDAMNPHMTLQGGTFDPETKTMEMKFSGFDAMTNRMVEGKAIERWVDDDTRKTEVWVPAPHGGDLVKFVELTYTRVK
jgi:hypothetical protein